jgi:hypothetical protein
MSIAQNTLPLARAPRLSQGLARFIDELVALAGAMANPGLVIAEVETMRTLHARADEVEARDPAYAARLRRQASRVGLR